MQARKAHLIQILEKRRESSLASGSERESSVQVEEGRRGAMPATRVQIQ